MTPSSEVPVTLTAADLLPLCRHDQEILPMCKAFLSKMIALSQIPGVGRGLSNNTLLGACPS